MMVTIEIPDPIGLAVQARAAESGVSVSSYVNEVLSRALAATATPRKPLKSGRGILAGFGPAPSAEEIDANRADMFRGFGESF